LLRFLVSISVAISWEIKKMPKAEEDIRVPGKASPPQQLQREILEIESKLKSESPELGKRAIEFLESRLSFLREKLEELNKN
jgi:hypothetical protein